MQLIEASILWVQAPSPIPKASFTSIVCHYMQHWMEELAVGKTTSKRPYIFFLVSLPYYHWSGVALHDIIWHHPWSFSKGNPNQDRPWKMTVGRLNFPFGITKFSGSTLDFQGVFTQNLELARSFGFPAIDLRCWSSWATQSRAEQWKVLFSFCLGSCTSHVDEYYSLGKSVKVPSMWRFMTYQDYIKKYKKKKHYPNWKVGASWKWIYLKVDGIASLILEFFRFAMFATMGILAVGRLGVDHKVRNKSSCEIFCSGEVLVIQEHDMTLMW